MPSYEQAQRRADTAGPHGLKRSDNTDKARDIPFYQHVERVRSGKGVTYMNGVAPSRLLESMDSSEPSTLHIFRAELAAAIPELNDNTLLPGASTQEPYFGFHTGGNKGVSDVLYGSKGSYSTIHADRHLSAPTFLYVVSGKKRVWIAQFGWEEAFTAGARFAGANGNGKEVQALLLEGARFVHPGLLSDLARLGVGEVHELGPGQGISIPPGFLHAAINLEVTASYNVSYVPFDLWPEVLESTMRREADNVLGAAKEAVGGSGPELEAKLEELWSARGKYFGEGMVLWVKDMVVREEKYCKGLMSDAVDGDRMGLESKDVRMGTSLSLLFTKADGQWGKRSLLLREGTHRLLHAIYVVGLFRHGFAECKKGTVKEVGPLLAMLQRALVTSTVDRRKK